MSALRFAVASSFALLFGVAYAQTPAPTTADTPLTQGISSVDKNLKKNPDNKGLQTASEQLKENQERFAQRQATTDQRIEDARAERFDAPVRPDRIERPGR